MEADHAVPAQLQVASLRERAGVFVGLAGLGAALVAALWAPGVPAWVRAGRVSIDVVLGLGFLAYLRGERTGAVPRRSLTARSIGVVSRALAIVLVLAGGVFALVAQGVDPWRRAFRAAIALALAVAIALGVGRTVPAGWMRRARVLTVGFVVLEAVVSFAAAVEIDAPIAIAGLAPVGRTISRQLSGEGYAFPPQLSAGLVRLQPEALELRAGRIVATARLADTLHVLGDDPIPALARIAADPQARAEWLRGDVQGCTLVRVVHPPLGGYRQGRYGATVDATVRACAKSRR